MWRNDTGFPASMDPKFSSRATDSKHSWRDGNTDGYYQVNKDRAFGLEKKGDVFAEISLLASTWRRSLPNRLWCLLPVVRRCLTRCATGQAIVFSLICRLGSSLSGCLPEQLRDRSTGILALLSTQLLAAPISRCTMRGGVRDHLRHHMLSKVDTGRNIETSRFRVLSSDTILSMT